MATEFTTEFDGTDGNPANLTTENPSGATINALTNRTSFNGWFYETSAKVSGTASVWTENEQANPTNTSVWQYTHNVVTTHYYDVCWRVTALPGSAVVVFQLRNGGTNKAQVAIAADGTIQLKNGTTNVDTTASGFAVAGQWLRIQWGITGTTQTLRLWTSATTADLLNNPTSDTLSGNYTGGGWDQFRMGVLSAVDLTIWLDRLVVDNSTWPTSGGASNVAPTADAGPDVDTYEGGDLVTLDGTDSADSDGTIASYLWTQTAGTTVTLSSTTASQPTFTAPDDAGTATFQLRVTDDDGAQSAPDTVVIEWSDAPTAVPTSDFYDLLDGASAGTTLTATPGNTDFDTVDAGWTFATAFADTSGIGAATATGSGAVKILTHNLASLTGDGYIDAIFQISDLSAGPWYIMRVLDGSTLRASVRVNTNGSIQCRNGTTAVGTETAAHVTAGVPFRVAWRAQNGAPGTQRARLFTGSNLFGTSPTSETSGNMNTGTYNRVGYGIAAPATSSGTLKVAIPQFDASDWPAPFGAVANTAYSEIYEIQAGPVYAPMALDIL